MSDCQKKTTWLKDVPIMNMISTIVKISPRNVTLNCQQKTRYIVTTKPVFSKKKLNSEHLIVRNGIATKITLYLSHSKNMQFHCTTSYNQFYKFFSDQHSHLLAYLFLVQQNWDNSKNHQSIVFHPVLTSQPLFPIPWLSRNIFLKVGSDQP